MATRATGSGSIRSRAATNRSASSGGPTGQRRPVRSWWRPRSRRRRWPAPAVPAARIEHQLGRHARPGQAGAQRHQAQVARGGTSGAFPWLHPHEAEVVEPSGRFPQGRQGGAPPLMTNTTSSAPRSQASGRLDDEVQRLRQSRRCRRTTTVRPVRSFGAVSCRGRWGGCARCRRSSMTTTRSGRCRPGLPATLSRRSSLSTVNAGNAGTGSARATARGGDDAGSVMAPRRPRRGNTSWMLNTNPACARGSPPTSRRRPGSGGDITMTTSGRIRVSAARRRHAGEAGEGDRRGHVGLVGREGVGAGDLAPRGRTRCRGRSPSSVMAWQYRQRRHHVRRRCPAPRRASTMAVILFASPGATSGA